MIIDKRCSLDVETVDKINAASEAIGDVELGQSKRAYKNATARYYRLIRKISGEPLVTTHMVEHNPQHFPAQKFVAFGR